MFIGLLDHTNICIETNFAFICALVPKIWVFKNLENLSGGHFEKSRKIHSHSRIAWGFFPVVCKAKWITKRLQSVCLQFCPGRQWLGTAWVTSHRLNWLLFIITLLIMLQVITVFFSTCSRTCQIISHSVHISNHLLIIILEWCQHFSYVSQCIVSPGWSGLTRWKVSIDIMLVPIYTYKMWWVWYHAYVLCNVVLNKLVSVSVSQSHSGRHLQPCRNAVTCQKRYTSWTRWNQLKFCKWMINQFAQSHSS